MIYNFSIVSSKRFSIGVDLYFRTYQIILKRNGKYKIRNIKDGSVLLNDVLFSELYIDGVPIQYISQIEDIILNSNCDCFDDPPEPEHRKIFDRTFDRTFE